MSKIGIVSGVPGQDASFLCELLLAQDYDTVIGVSRRSTRNNNNMVNCTKYPSRYKDITLDITDSTGVRSLIDRYQPDEFFNLAAMSHVGQSFQEPLTTLDIDGRAVVGILEAIRASKSDCRFYQASTSEMMGNNYQTDVISPIDDDSVSTIVKYQDETTPFSSRSPYAAAKIYAHNMVGLYRNAYGLHASCGILFNHCSPRRGLDFVTRKITHNVAKIKLGMQDKIHLGNLDPYRDIGHAVDYCAAMFLMLQQDVPDDYVIATGKATSIRDVLKFVCGLAELNWEDVYEPDERFMRPAEVDYLCGRADKARNKLKWTPTYSWSEILKEMYMADFAKLEANR